MQNGQLIDLGFKGQYWIIIKSNDELLAYRGVKSGATDFMNPANYSTSISLNVIRPEGVHVHADWHAFPAPSLWQMLK
jgi:hypothetical protein